VLFAIYFNFVNQKFSKKFEGPCVLQLVKTRNIAAPKENESSGGAPPMYKITLSDGILSVNALVIEDVNKLK
jgi:hypothetical protein